MSLVHMDGQDVVGTEIGPPDATWETKDGSVLLISEMTDRHLVHAANMLFRKADESTDLYESAVSCHMSFNSDSMASYYSSDAFDTWHIGREIPRTIEALTEPLEEILKSFAPMVKELKRRGLWVANPSKPHQLIVPKEG